MLAFSAPGKALVAGGYLVLFPRFKSYVVALSSRMHAIVEEGSKQNASLPRSRLTVRSPQFAEGEWTYVFDFTCPDAFEVCETDGKRNPFIEATLHTVLAYLGPAANFEATIVIYSDPGYHSQESAAPKRSANGNKKFLYHHQRITEVAKTGLGSSAGLVTVVTTALMAFLSAPLDISVRSTKDLIHNLAQVAHCSAQGKIGSGFDVAAAVYGSIVYRRFDPQVIEPLLTSKGTASPLLYARALRAVVDAQWEFEALACQLPPQVSLLMGDIAGGSETPRMVSKVLQWHREEPEKAEALFASLNTANMALVACLERLSAMAGDCPESYAAIVAAGDTQAGIFQEVRSASDQIRTAFRAMTTYTGAEIEPKEQTALLDACNAVPGVLCGVVPGAGGYDAICLLVLPKSKALLVEAQKNDEAFKLVEWLNLDQESEGIVVQSPVDYQGL